MLRKLTMLGIMMALLLSTLAVHSYAEAERVKLLVTLPYNLQPMADPLIEYFGFSQEQLSAGANLELAIDYHRETGEAEAVFVLSATGEKRELSAAGYYRLMAGSNLFQGEFTGMTADNSAYTLTVYYLPFHEEAQATISFAVEGRPSPAAQFGTRQSNIDGVFYQLAERERNAVKIPPSYLLDGVKLTFSVQPVIIDNMVLVPARALLQALGATVQWDDRSNRLLVTKGDIQLQMEVGKREFTMKGHALQFAVAPSLVSGLTMVEPGPLAASLGASILTRRDGTVSIISSEMKAAQTGGFRVIFAGEGNMLFINDTNQDLHMGGWGVSFVGLYSRGYGTFHFPQDFVLKSGAHVQVLAGEGVDDGRSVLRWLPQAGQGQQPMARPSSMHFMVMGIEPGREIITLNNQSAIDLNLSNWQFISLLGKPYFEFSADTFLASGASLAVNGRPGTVGSAGEFYWANFPLVEEQYLTAQKAQEQILIEQRLSHHELYREVVAELGIDSSGYYIYGTRDEAMLATGSLPPFTEPGPLATTLQMAFMRSVKLQAKVGDTAPLYLIRHDGQEAYALSIKADGSTVVFKYDRHTDEHGLVTWSISQ